MRVFLTGGTGFVGSHMLPRLARENHIIRMLARDPARAAAAVPDAIKAQVEIAAGDVVTGSGLQAAVEGCDAVIHLVGIIMEVGGATFEKSHHQATRNVLAAAQNSATVRRFVQMSALGARENGVSAYQITKWKAEEAVRSGGIPFVILRPSIIFGPRDGFVNQMVQVMRTAPLIRPVPGHGRYPFRPIYVDNVVDCFVQSLSNDAALGKTIELVGPEALTLEQMLAEIARCIGVKKPALKVPFPIMYMNAAIMGLVLPRPPVTTDQLRMLREGSTADPAPMMATFKVDLVGFRQGLKKYLCKA
ncbi:MAG TPA: complex I NDUFA9 subunit family protein [Terriglobales bacterium]|nr:complex I NDUFA9 subunit family protein [Terriglobales bacterium]